jgi:hypothetical protein
VGSVSSTDRNNCRWTLIGFEAAVDDHRVVATNITGR